MNNFNSAEIVELLQQKKSQKVMQVFIESDYLRLQDILNITRKFQSSIKTDKGAYRAEFRVKPSQDDINELNHLYQLFIRNGIPWKTVNHPYAFRMADVFLESSAIGPDEEMEISEISVDFQELPYFRIPLSIIIRIAALRS